MDILVELKEQLYSLVSCCVTFRLIIIFPSAGEIIKFLLLGGVSRSGSLKKYTIKIQSSKKNIVIIGLNFKNTMHNNAEGIKNGNE